MSQGTSTCQKCGATIYREHIDAGIARYEGGTLMCPHCVEEYEKSHDLSGSGVEKVESVAMEAGSGEFSESRIQAFGGGGFDAGGWDDSRFSRPLAPRGTGATRCRVFHSKLNEGALNFMTSAINDWLDGNDEITVKFMNATIGVFEGKKAEPNLIVTVFY